MSVLPLTLASREALRDSLPYQIAILKLDPDSMFVCTESYLNMLLCLSSDIAPNLLLHCLLSVLLVL